ncbi:MAG TPA: DNA-binding response regulator [Sutterella sp.]|nr:DNA-binding response regulator [Sutterella sp.]
MPEKPRLLQRLREKALIRVVDDDETVLVALRAFLEMDDWKVKTYRSAEAFLGDLSPLPGCMVLDVRMPGMNGIELQQHMLAHEIRTPIIFLSAHGDISLAVDAMRSGAVMFMEKPPKPERLLSCIEEAVLLDWEQSRRREDLEELERELSALTQAERQVAQMVAKGLSNPQIAAALGVSETTVRSQRSAIYAKLEVQNAVELADFFYEIARLRTFFERRRPEA